MGLDIEPLNVPLLDPIPFCPTLLAIPVNLPKSRVFLSPSDRMPLFLPFLIRCLIKPEKVGLANTLTSDEGA